MDKMILQGKTHVVIVDYADLLRGPSNKERHEELETIFEDLRGMAGEYEVPIWRHLKSIVGAEDDIIKKTKSQVHSPK